ncbi:MAG: hypothetical protein CVV06_00120 [Gammaproteobacteria bacterium HGW-Gammaproteobacteria-10]|nr:MAG: hypothetical protein CVV06_00120 [Gammaproteobacteria bacterium HGW-Gammaproteobacteria-10]
MKIKTQWQVHIIVIALPFSIPITAGGYWLWLNQLLFIWLGFSAMLGGGWWLVYRSLGRCNIDSELVDISAALGDSPVDQAAYQKIEEISAARREENQDLSSSQFYIQTVTEVMQAVAEQYHPKSKAALLEIKLPYLLKVIEILAQDLRHNLSENVPGSHILSLNDIAGTHKLANKGLEIYRFIRLLAAGIDPVSASIREMKILATTNVLTQSTGDLKCWLIDAFIKKIGYYAIELYRGDMILDERLLASPTRSSKKEIEEIQRREAAVVNEPFRIMVMGQAKAGKSSLINALFGEMKAETDVLPTTEGVDSYLFQRSGLQTAIMIDSEGYGADASNLPKKVSDEIIRSDMILLVVSASNAARDIDKKILQMIKKQFSVKGKANLPPIIVALTHIDQLRPFREWSPPYNLNDYGSAKAQSIRMVMESVALDLAISIDQIAPVNLKRGFEYNIEEGLIAAIFQHLDQAGRMRYLRCLNEYRKEDQWHMLWKQSQKAGQFIAKKGFEIFETAPKIKSALS